MDWLRLGARGPPWLISSPFFGTCTARGSTGQICRNEFFSSINQKCRDFSWASFQMYTDSFKTLSIPFHSYHFEDATYAFSRIQ